MGAHDAEGMDQEGNLFLDRPKIIEKRPLDGIGGEDVFPLDRAGKRVINGTGVMDSIGSGHAY